MNRKPAVEIVSLGQNRVPRVVEVLCDAFYDYPVMRFILQDDAEYDSKLRELVTMFVSARALRGSPVLGVVDDAGELAGAATVSVPNEVAAPPEFERLRDDVWRRLGGAALGRYERYGKTCMRFEPPESHHHLNMIGVRRTQAGKGFARPLLDAVHALCDAHPVSQGVSLSTELPDNVRLYEHFGYQVLGNARVDDTVETWVMYRARPELAS